MQVIKAINSDNPKDLSEFQLSLTCENSIDSVSLALIKKSNSLVWKTSIYALLNDLNDKVRVDKKFSESETPFLLDAIQKAYWYLTLEEIAYVFKNIIIGRFKKQYNKLDIETVLDAIHEYDSKERLNLLEKRDHNKKMEAKQLEQSAFKEVSKEFVSGMVKKIAEENNLDITSKDEVSEKEKAYQAYKMKYLNSKKSNDQT